MKREIAHPLSEWHEDIGPVLWWVFPLREPPYVGTPLDLGETIEIHTMKRKPFFRGQVGGWPGYHTHWTPLPAPPVPSEVHAAQQAALDRIADIDRAFAESASWGSWMVQCANEREGLVNQLREAGVDIAHQHLARTTDGAPTD